MNLKLDAFFKSPYLFEVGVYFRHMHLWRDPHVRKSPWSPTPSVFLRHPVKPLKKISKLNFESVLSSFTVFFLRKNPRRKMSSHQDPGISPTHQSVQKQWSEIPLRSLSPEDSLLRSEEHGKTELGSIHEFPFSQNKLHKSYLAKPSKVLPLMYRENSWIEPLGITLSLTYPPL